MSTTSPTTPVTTFLARAGAYLASLISAGWTATVVTVDWIGRTTVGDAWAKLPDFLRTWPWVPAVVLIALSAYLAYLGWPRPRISPEPVAAAPKEPEAISAAPSATPRLISDAIVVDGQRGDLPAFRGRFAQNGSGAVFYIEHSFFSPNVMGRSGWTQPRKTEVFRQERFARGQSVVFPIVSHRGTEQQGYWKIGVLPDDTDPIIARASYKGRITVLDASDREQHVYFILLPNGQDMPKVIGQHMFDHMLEWEGRDSTTGDPESLFT